MVHYDMVDANGDIAHITKHRKKSLQHIHDLKQMRVLDWELRVPVLDKELAQMTPQDMERGWQDAFETEKRVIHFSMLLSAEEMLSKKQQIREYDADIASLEAEREDLERDADELLLEETTLLETYRRVELHRASDQYTHHTNASVRRQRLRWKVRTNRTNVVRRETAAARAAVAASLAQPPTCVSFAGKMASLRETDKLVRQHEAATNAAKTAALVHGGCRNPHLLSVADAVVAKAHKILSSGSLAMHLDRTDVRDEDGAMCHTCGLVQCMCHMGSPESTSATWRVAGKAAAAPPTDGRRGWCIGPVEAIL
ncbi:hypothetical protein DYB32_006217 [Aphanomyces invadans]|uniref:Uncharacterized protein n=1 Tax=Aphanomyces invadans TaxID=157072 RepID=A0A3R6Z053_9STRA|nr:hypothetical protein DYB32_006217 [Aphanomyces invadans]